MFAHGMLVILAMAFVDPIGSPKHLDVSIPRADDFALQGEFVTPSSEGKFPAILLLSGSGPTDGDGNTPLVPVKIDLQAKIAQYVGERGIASLRFDKRAVAKYASHWPKDPTAMAEWFGWEPFVQDVEAALGFLRSRPEVDASKVALFGHSEGTLFAIEVAKRDPDKVAALVLAASPGRSLADVIREQVLASLRRANVSKSESDELMAANEAAIAYVIAHGQVPPNMPAGLAPLYNASAVKLLQDELRYDPAKEVRELVQPVLVINGERDMQVSSTRDATPLYEALKTRKDKAQELVLLPGASHVFKSASSDTDFGFEGPVLPAFLEKLESWLKARFG